MSLDESNIVARARDGKLSEREIALLIDSLERQSAGTATYTRLNALGWTMRPDLAHVVSPFLSSPDDSMLSRLALQILVSRWGLGLDFADVVIEFASGVEWDEDDDVRLVALSSAGELARVDIRTADMFGVLIRALDDAERPIVRDAAYSAVLRGLGTPWNEVPGAGRVHDGTVQMDPAVVARAAELAGA